MNFTASSVVNVRANSSASLMTTAGGVHCPGRCQHFGDGHPQNQPVENRHPFRPPTFGGFGDQRIDAVEPLDRFLRQRCRELAQFVGRFPVGPLMLEKRLGGSGNVAARELPLIEDLQRRFARSVAAIFLLTPGVRLDATTARPRRPSRAPPPPLRILYFRVPDRRAPTPLPQNSSSTHRTPSERRWLMPRA